MYIVVLRLGENRDRASSLMSAHNAWIGKGFDDGVFILTGTLAGRAGGAVLAHGESRAALERRVQSDPFVAEGVVKVEIIELEPGRYDDRLKFLAG